MNTENLDKMVIKYFCHTTLIPSRRFIMRYNSEQYIMLKQSA